MKTLHDVLCEAQKNKVAVGHFNVSDLAGLKAVFESARQLSVPVIVGFPRVSVPLWECARLRR